MQNTYPKQSSPDKCKRFNDSKLQKGIYSSSVFVESPPGGDIERTVGIYPGSSWTIVDTEDVLGVNLNIKPKR